MEPLPSSKFVGKASKHSNRCSCETEAESVAQQSSLPINPALVLGYAQLQGSCRKAQGSRYTVKTLITSMQANNNCCSFLMLLILFPMQDLEKGEFVYWSIQN